MLNGSVRIATEAHNGITAQALKEKLFNSGLDAPISPETAVLAAQGKL
jgi:hypothetical protein